MSNVPGVSMEHQDCDVLCSALVRRANKEGTQILSIWGRYSEFLKVGDSKMGWTWNTLIGSRSYGQAAWVYKLANSRSASMNHCPFINPLLFEIQQPTGHGSDPRGNHDRNTQIGEVCRHSDRDQKSRVQNSFLALKSLSSRQPDDYLHSLRDWRTGMHSQSHVLCR